MDAALLTAISALTVAVLSGASQLWQIILKTKLEGRKQREERVEDLGREAMKVHDAALAEICRALQGFQDELLLLSKSSPGSLLAGDVKRRLIDSRDKLLSAYQQHHPTLNDGERRALLEARERSVDIIFFLDQHSAWKGEYIEVDQDSLTQIDRTMTALGYHHQRLLLGGLQRMQIALEAYR